MKSEYPVSRGPILLAKKKYLPILYRTYVLFSTGAIIVLILLGCPEIHVGDLKQGKRGNVRRNPKKSIVHFLVHPIQVDSTISYIVEQCIDSSAGTAVNTVGCKGTGNGQESQKESNNFHHGDDPQEVQ